MSHRRSTAVRVAGIVGGLALLITIGTASLASGNAGDPLLLGRSNGSSATTYLNWDKTLFPWPETGLAVVGGSTGAVFATNEEYAGSWDGWLTGVSGYGSDRGGDFYGVDEGLRATSEYVGARVTAGEVGLEASGQVGVEATGSDVGLTATGPVALRTEGAVSFSSAGLVVIPQGATSATVRPGTDVTSSTMVLATAQSLGGQVKRATRNATAGTVTIVLTAKATQPVTVAYFVIG